MNPLVKSSLLPPDSSVLEFLEVMEAAVIELGWSERIFVSVGK